MGKDHLGQPAGANKSEEPTGIPSSLTPENEGENRDKTQKYTDDDGQIADHVRTAHPNRNEDKGDATNIGGYRS